MSTKAEDLANRIRQHAVRSFVEPARRSGRRELTISVRDLMRGFGSEAKGQQSTVCAALRARKFKDPNRLRLESWEGPPSGRGSSVVYHYRIEEPVVSSVPKATAVTRQEAEHIADKYLEPLRGLLAKELAAFGGGEKFLQWVRSEEK